MTAQLPRSDKLDATFAALSDPTRRAIVARLASGEATVLELAEPFDISLPAISRHLKVLEQAGLIERGRDAQKRPCRLRGEALGEVVQWAEHTKRAWEERFDRLDAYLEQMKAHQAGADATSRNPGQQTHARVNRGKAARGSAAPYAGGGSQRDSLPLGGAVRTAPLSTSKQTKEKRHDRRTKR